MASAKKGSNDATKGSHDEGVTVSAAAVTDDEGEVVSYQVGITVDGVFVPLIQKDASYIIGRVEAAKAGS